MLLKDPAWQSLQPGLPEYVRLDYLRALQLCRALNIDGTAYQAFFETKASHFYKIEQEKISYFIKKAPRSDHSHYQQAEKIAAWLKQQQIAANAAINMVDSAELDAVFYVYPLLDGVRLLADALSLRMLGEAVGKLHQTLRAYPELQLLKENTASRINRLETIRTDLAAGKYKLGPCADYVYELANHPGLSFNQGQNSQALHGDLNPGNILLYQNSIAFFDFEDTVHSVLPPIYELAYIIERLILNRTTEQSQWQALGQVFIKAYQSHGGNYQYQEKDEEAWLALALRAFCVLTLCELENKPVADLEWYKFQKLAEFAKNNQPILKGILQV